METARSSSADAVGDEGFECFDARIGGGNFNHGVFTRDGGLEAAGFFYRAYCVFGKLGETSRLTEPVLPPVDSCSARQTSQAACTSASPGFVTLFGAEVLLLEGGDFIGVKRVAGKGF